MKIKPQNGKILVQTIEIENKTQGGLFIPDTAKSKRTTSARVVQVYDEYFTETGVLKKPFVKVGDIVLYDVILYDIGLPDRMYLIDEKSILATVQE